MLLGSERGVLIRPMTQASGFLQLPFYKVIDELPLGCGDVRGGQVHAKGSKPNLLSWVISELVAQLCFQVRHVPGSEENGDGAMGSELWETCR